MSREDEIRQGLFDGTLYGRAPQVKALTEEALAPGIAPLDILVGFSAFLAITMPRFKVKMEARTKAGLGDRLKVMVGGAPVTQDYATKMGADGYAATASATVQVAKALMQSMGYDISGGATVSTE